ncbi:MAG: YgjP-like metallopeptidase domain-containing protein [Opitutales bacterium]
MLEFEEDGQVRSLRCELRKSKRTRRINLRLKSTDFALLTFPSRMAWATAEKFLMDHQDWLERKSQQFPVPISMRKYFEDGGKICLGPSMVEREVSLTFDEYTDRPLISLENQQIGIRVPRSGQEDEMIKLACRKLAYQFLPGWLEWAENYAGLYSKRLRIGDQRTRWGSCSPKGTLSLNWRIILLPQELGSYVIFHELAHLAQMNHSPKFWQKLEEFVPDARAVDRKLTKDGKVIFSLGRSG